MKTQFEWHENKSRTNRAKHGVSLEIAKRVWEQPHVWTYFDRHEVDEDRIHAVGVVGGLTLLTVIHRDDAAMEIIRIVGARRATRHDKSATDTADLTPEMIEELKALAALPDDEIDTDDIPDAPIETMRQGVRGPHFRKFKTPVTIRLDADVIAGFKATAESGKYQSEINRLLRQHMADSRRKSA